MERQYPGSSLGGWHFGTVPRAPRSKGAPRYGSDRRNGWWMDDQSKLFSLP